MFCQIPLYALRAEPWNLKFDDLIRAKISACNLNGCSEESDSDSQTRIETEPGLVSTLVEGILTNEEQIEVKWQPLTTYIETKGSPVTSYNLRWDAGSNG
jgi:hypothetical protein